ncbi:hypothetical protein [Chryseobacterium salivictor]|uniref:Uncharacterized protein n=1 Tax=Chryseobacterium salivictor TaxID=2547600 RepID=A0A4V1AKY2_9FLAO|nr:hypothetical protein [Chryseobacterium salivictor]QBO57854.1 hypothetical protein NBC122_01025 [Chryseobacterium salivictor]
MEKNKFLWIAFGIVMLIVISNNIFRSEQKQKGEKSLVEKMKPTLIFDGQEYFSHWKDTADEKFLSISKLLVADRITGCGEFYYNEIDRNTYIVACSRDGKSFKYYVAWTKLDKVYSAESDMLTINESPK